MVGSHAAQTCEPRQVRKEATVNRTLRVPWERLTGVMLLVKSACPLSKGGARSLIAFSNQLSAVSYQAPPLFPMWRGELKADC